MILPLFLALMALAALVCVLGYLTNDEPYLPVGLSFFFLLAIIILTGNLEYQTGDVKATNFTYTNSTLTSQVETSTITFTAWDDATSHKVGWLLAAISVFGVALSMRNIRNQGADD